MTNENEVDAADLAAMQVEVQEFARANAIFTSKRVWEALESRPAGMSLAEALCEMLNQAHAVGYVSAKREMKPRKIVLFPGYGES